MADSRFTAATALPDPPAPSGRCRIDYWSPQGWRPVAGFGEQADAEAMLADLHRREPQTLFRLVRRIDPGDLDPAPPPAPSAPRPTRDARPAAAPPAADSGRRLAQLAGALGLVALVGLVCAARWMMPPASESTSRSAASLAGGEADALGAAAAPAEAAPAVDATAGAAPAALAGRWSTNGGDCRLGEIRFAGDHQLSIAADGSRHRYAIAGYAVEPGGIVRIAYVGGATAAYAATAGRLTLDRARIARIDISPQQPLVLEPCTGPAAPGPAPSTASAAAGAGRLPNTARSAFRLAVQVGDDLAATLALAHGMPVTGRLDAPGAPTPLDWVVAHGRAVLVGKLVAAGADPNAADAQGATLLSRAVQRGDVAAVEALIAAGADPARPDRDGRRPLEIAGAMEHQLLVDILFAALR